jgi:hypothetical protein
VPRFDSNPSTQTVNGLLIEEARTNSLRNNTTQGAVIGVVGSGGSLGTYYSQSQNTGITPNVVSVGVDNGINYIDVQFSGTITGGGLQNNIFWESSGVVAASNSQTWTQSVYLKLVSGSMSGIVVNMYTLTDNPSYINGNNPTLSTPTGASLSSQRNVYTFTTNSSGVTVFTNLGLAFTFAAGTFNFTIRIGMPQLELGAFATSVVATSGSAATRAAEQASLSLGSWYNAKASTLLVEAQKNTSADANYSISLQLDDGTNLNRLEFYTFPGSTTIYLMDQYTSNITDASVTPGSFSLSTPYKVAGSISGALSTTGTIAASLNGATAASGTTGNFAGSTFTTMRIGGVVGGSLFMNGWIRRIAYWPTSLSNAELISLTS